MKTLYTILFLAIYSISYSQQVSTFPGIPYTAFNYFDVDEDFIATLGSCDQFWYSTDDGDTWSHEVMDDRYFAIKILRTAEGRQLILGGNGALVLKDIDNNTQTMVLADAVNNNGYNRVIELIGDNVFIFNNYGIVRGNYDGTTISDIEEVWSAPIENDYVYTTSVVGNDIFLGMRNGSLYRYNTLTDEVVPLSDFGNWVYNLAMGSSTIGYAVVQGQSGLLKTANGGVTWEIVEEMPESINPLVYGEEVVITLNTNRIYQSLDGGSTSTYIKTDVSENWSLASAGMFTEDGTLYIVGRGSMIVKSEDFGATYIHLNPYNRSYMYGLDITESGEGLAVGSYNRILSTADHGNTWAEMDLNIPGDNSFSAVEILDDGKLLIASNEELILYDNGVISSTEKYILDIYEDEQEDFIMIVNYDAGNSVLEKSIDGGQSWIELLRIDEYTPDIKRSPNGKFYFGGLDGIVNISEDNGDTWTTKQFGTQSVDEILFLTDEIGFILTQGKLRKTIDGGETFYDVASGYSISDFTMLNENQFFYHSRQNSATHLYESIDGGESFSLHYLSCTPTNHMELNGEGNLVLAQSFGHINVVAPSPMTSDEEVDFQSESFSIYPNPASRNQEIFIDVEYDEVAVYKMDGTLVINRKNDKNSISTRNLASGLYIISVSVGNRKMQQKLLVN